MTDVCLLTVSEAQIHNNPENLKPPPHVQHLRFTLADVDTADISRYFNTAYEFIDDAMRKGQGELQEACSVPMAHVRCCAPYSACKCAGSSVWQLHCRCDIWALCSHD